MIPAIPLAILATGVISTTAILVKGFALSREAARERDLGDRKKLAKGLREVYSDLRMVRRHKAHAIEWSRGELEAMFDSAYIADEIIKQPGVLLEVIARSVGNPKVRVDTSKPGWIQFQF